MDDLPLEGELHVVFVRSDLAHARITGVDASEAAARDGVRVFTASDLELPVYPAPPFVGLDERMFRPLLAREKVRFVGDIVAAVLADSRAAAVDAAELVIVDYDPLPAVTDAREAVRDEVLLYDEVGTNVCLRHPPESPDPQIFDGCEVVDLGVDREPAAAGVPGRAALHPRRRSARTGASRSTSRPRRRTRTRRCWGCSSGSRSSRFA